jgi:chromosome segregation ATPase
MYAEFQKLEKEYETKSHPIRFERDGLDKKVSEASGYQNELHLSCRDAALKMEYETAQRGWDSRFEADVYERYRNVGYQIADLKTQQNNVYHTISRDRDDKLADLKDRIRSLEEELTVIESKKLQLAEQKTAHEKAVEEVRQRMIFS